MVNKKFKMNNFPKDAIAKLQVSSYMRNDKSFRKQNIFDGCDDTCWSSDEGSPQWIWIEFKEPKTISNFSIQFQGGFVGKNCQAEFTHNDEFTTMPFYPEDINAVQKFILEKPVISKQVKFEFEGSTDFFGRVVVYTVDFQ